MESKSLMEYIEFYGTDKNLSGYGRLYQSLFDPIKDTINTFLEIGIGTFDPVIPSTFVGNARLYPQYTPGGSLRAWRDYFIKAKIYGIDIAEDCAFKEDRLESFIFSSLDRKKANKHFKDKALDIIIDDGLHTAIGQLETLRNFFPKVKDGGYYIIEDCGGGGDNLNIFEKYEEEFREIADNHEYYFGGNIIFIRKNNSRRGRIGDFNTFTGVPLCSPLKSEENKPNIKEYVGSLSVEERDSLLKYLETSSQGDTMNKNLTIVTGLWNIGRPERDFDHYIANFKKFLDIPNNLFIYIPKEYEYLVWEKRSKLNTYVKIYELEDVKTLYSPFWDKTQEIRNNPEWVNSTGESGWLKNSPQAVAEWYNPIVQSKMFMLNDATLWNPFGNEYFIWLDAGITNTVRHDLLIKGDTFDKIIPYLDNFLFLSYPYENSGEIHGFNAKAIDRYAGCSVKYVCRGGLFGGNREAIHEANSTYYSILNASLQEGYMGTEESIFAIMAHREPELYRRYSLDSNGLIVKFIDALVRGEMRLEPVSKGKIRRSITNYELSKIKTNLYILTFNFPEQLRYTISSMEKTPEWLTKPKLVLMDNSTDEGAKKENREIAEQYNFEYVDLGGNTGICGGRQAAAEHFDASDADFMFFFEDDMTSNPPELEGQFCRNGFRKYIPNLYSIVHKIMLKEGFDFLKLSFTEVYLDNNIQTSWYNVPPHIRTRDWPDYDQLPVSGLDPNSPRTKFDRIDQVEGVSYITGEVYYANWPMIVSKEGNRRMFLDTKWARPYEQTWMSHMYQKTKEGDLNPAVLLASPIWHERIKYYKPEERREN